MVVRDVQALNGCGIHHELTVTFVPTTISHLSNERCRDLGFSRSGRVPTIKYRTTRCAQSNSVSVALKSSVHVTQTNAQAHVSNESTNREHVCMCMPYMERIFCTWSDCSLVHVSQMSSRSAELVLFTCNSWLTCIPSGTMQTKRVSG